MVWQTCVSDLSQSLLSLAPKKPNWDLKRDVAKKLEKLDRRTQRAIAELLSTSLCSPMVTLYQKKKLNNKRR